MFTRRQFIGTTGLAVPSLAFPAVLRGAAPEAPVATTAQGKVRGLIEGGVNIFRGIPYGGSVSGPDHRFRAPPPPVAWTGVRDATGFGPVSPQQPRFFTAPGEIMAEDCLVLNVWTPALDGRKRPVMVYQHGGGFLIGSGSAPWQDGSALAREHDVVVVQSNHRLGLVGYLYLGGLLGPEYEGNQGLMDLVASLRWINENIAAFGGDPHNVMIFGESGGGGKVASLYAMPAAAPYFHKASIESPIGPGRTTPEQATETARQVLKRLGTSNPRNLLTAPLDALIKAQIGNLPPLPPGAVRNDMPADAQPAIGFWPFIDGKILPEEPFLNAAPQISARKPLIIGTCKDESVFFQQGDPTAFNLDEQGLKARLEPRFGDRTGPWIDAFRKSRPNATPSQLFIAITTAQPWRANAIHIAERKAEQGSAPVYSYILDYPSPEKVRGTDYPEGSPHASDISMKFNTAPLFGPKAPARLATARNMSSLWAGFARTGVPHAKGLPQWKRYGLKFRNTMIIDGHCRVVSDPESKERQFFMGEPNAIREPGL